MKTSNTLDVLILFISEGSNQPGHGRNKHAEKKREVDMKVWSANLTEVVTSPMWANNIKMYLSKHEKVRAKLYWFWSNFFKRKSRTEN
jgi:hypothetical protein